MDEPKQKRQRKPEFERGRDEAVAAVTTLLMLSTELYPNQPPRKIVSRLLSDEALKSLLTELTCFAVKVHEIGWPAADEGAHERTES